MEPSGFPEITSPSDGGPDDPGEIDSIVKSLFDLSPDAVLVVAQNGVIRDANPCATAFFGYTRSEFRGRQIEDLLPERFREFHPGHREEFDAHPRQRQMGVAKNLFGLRKDGTEFAVDVTLKAIETSSGPIVLSFVRDVTDQRNALDALQFRDRQLRSIVESINDYAVYLLDENGNVKTWNPGAKRIKGYSEEEIVGLHFSRFFTEEDRQHGKPAGLLMQAAVHGRAEDESWRVRKDGSRFWANSILTSIKDERGTISGYAKVTRDFTDRKRAEQALLLQLTSAMLANMNEQKLLQAISASILELVPHDSATLGLIDREKGVLVVQFFGATMILPKQGYVHLPLHGSPAGDAFRTGRPIILERIEYSSYEKETVEHFTALGMHSGCWVPLTHMGETIGVLAVASCLEGIFSTREADLLMQIADQVAMAVNSAIAFSKITNENRLLRQYASAQ